MVSAIPTPDGLFVDDSTVQRLSVAIGRLNRRLRQEGVAPDELTLSQLSAISTVYRLGSITLGELAAEERVKPPTMSRIVDRLEVDGYLRRTPDPRDRRCVRVELAEGGTRVLAGSRSRRDASLSVRLATLATEEQERLPELVDLLEQLLAAEAS